MRWKIERFHRETKQTASIEGCPCRLVRSQRNHIACAILVWVRLKQVTQRQSGTLLARLENVELSDWPWYRADFRPTAAFAPYQAFFDDEYRLLQDQGATEEWLAAYAKIESLRLALVADDGTAIFTGLLLHVEGIRLYFRLTANMGYHQ